MSNFSRKLRELRTERGLSQQVLADKIKLSKSSINMYERGEREPSFETLEKIADFFNVDMNNLLGSVNVLDSGFPRKKIPPKVSDKAVKIVTQIDSQLYDNICILADEHNRSFENELEYILYWATENELEELDNKYNHF